MRALIIEDEPHAQKNMISLLESNFPQVEVMGVAGSVKSTLQWLEEHKDGLPDVIFMDVELADGNCFDIFAKTDLRVPVIMTTAYDSYAVKAFEVNSLDYLLKPVEVEDLRRALSRVKAGEVAPPPQAVSAPKEKFLIRLNDRIVPVHTRDIAYFYSEAKNSYIVTRENRKYVLDDSLDAIEQNIPRDGFFRISRSCIIAESVIESVSKLLGGRLRISLVHGLDNNTDLTVSRARVDSFMSWLEK
jgi:DNA-binding LytR/AlgR family response regulator